MRTIDQLTDNEIHSLYCIAVGKRDDLNYDLKVIRKPYLLRIEKGKELLQFHYYKPSIHHLIGELSVRARNYEGLAAQVQMVSVIRFLEQNNVTLSIDAQKRHVDVGRNQSAFAIIGPDNFVYPNTIESTMFDVELNFKSNKKHFPDESHVGRIEIIVSSLSCDLSNASVKSL